MKSVCVFCGSNRGCSPVYAEAAESLAVELAQRGLELVYGGGNVGLMGLLADAALAAGVRVTGVIPEALAAVEVAHGGLARLHVVKTMHERKALMAELSDGFLALPGGFGTFEEFCEAVTWSQLGLYGKPCGLLNVRGYFDPLLDLFVRAEREGFLRPEHTKLVLTETHPGRLVDQMARWEAPSLPKWIESGEL